MRYKWMMFIVVVVCLAIFGCSKSKAWIEEKRAQDLLTSTNLQDRNQGVSILFRLLKDDFSLSKKIESLVIQTLDNEIQIKKSFEEQAKAEGKDINQIMEEFDKKYPHREYTDYLDSLASLIAKTRSQKGIRIVFQFVLYGGYVFDDAILTNFGAPAFDFLIERITQGSDDERELAMSMLSLWINPPPDSDHIDPKSITPLTKKQKEQLKPLLLKGFEGSNLETKYYTIRGLGAFLDQPEIGTKLLELTTRGETEEIRSQAKRILEAVNR